MDQPISRPMHGVLADYPYLLAVSTAPETVGFAEDSPTATALCRAIGGGVLATSLLTRAEWGVVRVLPYKAHLAKAHLAIDLGTSLFALAAPWLFGFAKNEKARNTFLAMGAVGLVAGALCKPEEMPDPSVAAPRAKRGRSLTGRVAG